MKPKYMAAASSIVLGLTLTIPAFAGEQNTRSPENQQSGMETGQSVNPGSPDTGSGQEKQTGNSSESVDMSITSAEEVTGKAVVNNSGDEIGEVDKIVRDKETGKLSAVVSVGGFLGIGERKVAIAVQDLVSQDDRLLSQQAGTEEQLKAYPAYDESKFDEVADQQIVQLGTSPGGDAGSGAADTSFSSLDENMDGYLSKEEASPELTRQWNSIDSNQDDQIDRIEFAAFETGHGQESGAPARQNDESTPGNSPSSDGSMPGQEETQPQGSTRY